MVTAQATLYAVKEERRAKARISEGVWASCALTPIAILVHGFHPYAEDGGVYLAGVKRLLDPELYPRYSGFVTTHLQFSLFAPAVAVLVHKTHFELMAVIFGLYFLSIWLTLFASWLVAMQCWAERRACCGAVCMLAMVLTVPVAGTSLLMMDPYLTARSVSTPFGLLALAAALRFITGLQTQHTEWKPIAACAGSLAVAAAAHPLMAVYWLGCVLVLIYVSLPQRVARIAATAMVCAVALLLAGSLQWLGPKEHGAYSAVANTRTYWFLSNWEWYELFGLVGPPAVLLFLSRAQRGRAELTQKMLAEMSAVCGALATVVVILFVRTQAANYELAMLQPLRVYQVIYAVMFLAIGASLSNSIVKARAVTWAALLLAVGGGMLFVQLRTFPNSAHVELPGRIPENAWEQGFDWARLHTKKDALFALDANYVTVPGEDSQNFRAIAERSALPDFGKDGGIASIAPSLTADWLDGETVQKGLDEGVGPAEIDSLRAHGVSWVIVLDATPTALECPYSNRAVKICRVWLP